MPVIRDFESQDGVPVNSNWNAETNTRDKNTTRDNYETTNPIEGSASRALAGDGGGTSYKFTRDSAYTPTELTFLLEGKQRDGWSGDGSWVRPQKSGARMGMIELQADGSIGVNGSTVSGSWSLDVVYVIRFYNIDYAADTFDWEVKKYSDGTVEASGTGQAFENSLSNIDEIEYGMSNGGSGGTVESYWDLFQEPDATISGTVTLSGSAVSGAKVTAINDGTDIVEGTATTDANGDYSVTVAKNATIHVAVQYDDGGGNQYNAKSKPFIAT